MNYLYLTKQNKKMSAIQNQILLKSKLAWQKKLVGEAQANETQIQVEISELKNVKGF